jgi:plastocyanin
MKTPRTIWNGSRHIAVAVVVLAATLLAGSPAPAARPITVEIKDFKFTPATLTVPVGATVTWTNDDEEPHTITSATGTFSSTGLSHEETFTQKFTRPGTYAYFCALHPHMKATVIVR